MRLRTIRDTKLERPIADNKGCGRLFEELVLPKDSVFELERKQDVYKFFVPMEGRNTIKTVICFVEQELAEDIIDEIITHNGGNSWI